MGPRRAVPAARGSVCLGLAVLAGLALAAAACGSQGASVDDFATTSAPAGALSSWAVAPADPSFAAVPGPAAAASSPVAPPAAPSSATPSSATPTAPTTPVTSGAPAATTPAGAAKTTVAPAPPGTSPAVDAVAAETVVKAAYAGFVHALQTGDLSAYYAATTPDCPCRPGLATEVQNLQVGKEVWAGDGFQDMVVGPPELDANQYVLTSTYTVEPFEIRDANGIAQQDQGRITGRQDHVTVVRSGTGWLVSGVQNFTPGQTA